VVVAVVRRTLVGTLAVLAFAVPAIAGAASRHLGDRVLKAGMHGQDVRVLQDFLTRAGFETDVDGEFGPATQRGVRKFERSTHRKVDGVVDASDAEALRELASSADGGFQPDQVTPVSDSPTAKASLASDGTAIAPATAPPEIQAVIAAANEIAKKPYRYGGGHGRFNDSGYDCSGSVSYALHGADLVEHPLDSSDFARWGERGKGAWITVYTNPGHAYMVVAGLRFDTSGKSRHGSRWQRSSRSARGYVARHPDGL
jgi:peptidoglycan hydrolase-like protein with peptidoglycan-binding domain